MSFAHKIIHNHEVLLERRDPADIHLLGYNSSLNLDSAFIIPALRDMVPYKVLIVSEVFRVSLINFGLQPYIHKEFNSCFLF
jgi:hypothetical protein